MIIETRERRGGNSSFAALMARWFPRHWQRWAVVGLAALLLLLVVFRRPLSDRIWPEASAQAFRDRAARALAHGRLTAADGSGARELYEAALAIDPDANDARTGLMRVAQAALVQATVAIDHGRYADAHQALQLARALSAPQAQVDAASARLRQDEGRLSQSLEQANARASRALRAGNLALATDHWQAVLKVDASNRDAVGGLQRVASAWAHRAER